MDIDLTLLLQMGLLALLVAILRPWVCVPLLEVIDRRAQAIQGTRAEAQRLERMAAADRQAYEQRMQQARREALHVREQLRQSGRAQAAQIVGTARAEAAARWLAERRKIDSSAQAVAAQLAQRVEALATEVTARLIGARR